MPIQAGAEPMDECNCANVQRSLVQLRRPWAARLQAMRDDPQENAQHHVEHGPVALHEVAQPLRHRKHPLAHRQAGEAGVCEVRRRLHHAPCIARGADTPAFAGEGYEVVVSTVITAGAGKAVRKDAAFQIFCKRLAHIGLGCVVIALAVELTRAGQL